ncbi:hypothetical protein LXL04_006885 [Taraxacum kok-saghyz]
MTEDRVLKHIIQGDIVNKQRSYKTMLAIPIKDTNSSSVLPDKTCQRLTLVEIQSATNNFDETFIIGRGGFGDVYKCRTMRGSVQEVAVKRLHSMSNQGTHEFEAEVQVLSKLRHGNLVSLIGYCNEGNEMALVYEFMPNGTLEDNLHKSDSSLSWLQRLTICIGAARGLEYLHTGTSTQHGVVHRDVKSSNILLDGNFDAKISDFGLAKVGLRERSHMTTAVKGKFGYIDPCYFYTGKLTEKSDVYAFGVVLFEILSGRKALDSTLEEQWGLAGWAQHQIKHGKLNQIIDPRIIGQFSKKCLKEFANIAGHCLHSEPKQRPTMAEIVVKLESILSQERENTSSVIDEEGFIYKLRSLFTGKVDAVIGTKGDLNEVDVATRSKSDSSSHHTPIVITDDIAIESNINQSLRTFTYDELASATNYFKDVEYLPISDEYIYKGWVDETTYAPTECGVGFLMYVRRMHILTPELDIKRQDLNPPNHLKVLGYCLNNDELFYDLDDLHSIGIVKEATKIMEDLANSSSSSSSVLPDQTSRRFTFAEIQSATNNFDETLVIGHGGFGKVYKCPIKIGSVREVAVKRLHSMSNQGAHEFEAEVQVLSKLRHGNLVSLLGYCNEGNDMALVYEFMPNGTLDEKLHKPDPSLSWLQLLKICIGAARGLDYLHIGTSTQHGVIHRDVKSSNILLDANFDAKISDFGLAKVGFKDRTHVSTAVKGTFGYMDPFYFYTGKLTITSDVYSFGVVLFEVLSGREALDPSLEERWGLAGWAQHQIKVGKLNQIIDPRLIGQISRKCLKEFASIARQCLHAQPKQRPTMAEVVVKLESILSQERERSNSVVDEEGLVYKLRSLFTGKVDTEIRTNSNYGFRTFTYPELRSATNGFKYSEYSPTLDEDIYKGWIDERTYAPTQYGVGLAIYVTKMMSPTLTLDIKIEEFNHPNLVKLVGYCLNTHELFCVYEVISGITLDKYLYGEPKITSLSWVARLKLAIGAAEGLLYLQKRNKPAYTQFKTNFILVDTDFNARLSDFVSDPDGFQFGDAYYAAPEWFRYQADTFDGICCLRQPPEDEFAVKSEIYAFGVVLLEILTGLKAYDEKRPLENKKLVTWAIPLLADERNLGRIMDPQLRHFNFPPNGAFKLAQLVSKCLERKQDKRPSMEEILQIEVNSQRRSWGTIPPENNLELEDTTLINSVWCMDKIGNKWTDQTICACVELLVYRYFNAEKWRRVFVKARNED